MQDTNELITSECLCIDVKGSCKATIKDGHLFNSIIMTFINENTNEEIVVYFNSIKSKSGILTVHPESKFARLHRCATGRYKRCDYSRVNCLFKSLKGLSYFVTYSQTKTKYGSVYLKGSTVVPVDLIRSELWSEKGQLLLRKTSPKQIQSAAKNKQNLCEKTAKNKQDSCKKTVIEKAEEPHFYSASPPISTACQHSNRTSFQHSHNTTSKSNHIYEKKTDSHNANVTDTKNISEPVNKTVSQPRERQSDNKSQSLIELQHRTDRTRTSVNNVNPKERVYEYYQHHDEGKDEYHDRVIEEIFDLTNTE